MAGETEVLQELGLTQNEARLYFLLLKCGKAKATDLAARSGMHRRVVYDTLVQLEKKGMAGIAEVGGVKTFTPSPPSSLLSFLDEKRDAMEGILPSLSRVFEAEKATSASVMHGRQAVKTIVEDILALRADYCVYYGQMQIHDALPKFIRIFYAKKKKLGIKSRMILLDTAQARERGAMIPLSENKFIDPSAPSPGVWWTYADRLALVLWHEEPTVILIKDEHLAKTFRQTFDRLFDSKTQIYKGDSGMLAIMEETLKHKETLFIGAGGQASERYAKYLGESYVPRAMKKRHKWLLLSNRRILSTLASRYPISTVRLLPKDWEYSPNVVWIYGNFVTNVVWLDEPVAFVVEDRHVADAYRKYFWLMWKMAKIN
ncbi:MAG: helix-turn-helix domain-containing protein [Candidatus Micrarchaeia archaeon]|jgi:sugar-specific transcriptional regulator TrmB